MYMYTDLVFATEDKRPQAAPTYVQPVIYASTVDKKVITCMCM